MNIDSKLPNFRGLSPAQRLKHIAEAANLSDADHALLGNADALSLETANGMIENVIGTFQLPMAVAGYFQINGRDVLVPMAVEEPSISPQRRSWQRWRARAAVSSRRAPRR